MPCERVDRPGGSRAIVCVRRRHQRCTACGELGADRLCDFPLERARSRSATERRTCSAPLHAGCAVTDADRPGVDLCPSHPREPIRVGQLELGIA